MAEKKTERAGAARRPAAKGASSVPGHFQTLRLERKNWILFGSGIASIAIGFGVLTAGDITLAPILLLAGYLVLIPWALVAQPRGRKNQRDGEVNR